MLIGLEIVGWAIQLTYFSCAETRKTYRAVLSEPKLVIPPTNLDVMIPVVQDAPVLPERVLELAVSPTPSSAGQKRPHDEALGATEIYLLQDSEKDKQGEGSRKKKKKKQG